MKKGFTLVEMLAVIVIIGIISTIAFISTSAISKSSREKAYSSKVASIETAAVKYIQDDPSRNHQVNVSTLLSSGYIKSDAKKSLDCPITKTTRCIIDPRDTDKELTNCKVNVTVENSRYKGTLSCS